MAWTEDIGIGGRVHIEVRTPGGEPVSTLKVKNLVTLEGRKLLGGVFAGQSALSGRMLMAVGTGTTATRLADTTLEAETTRVQAQVSDLTVEEEDGGPRVILRVSAVFPPLKGDAVESLREAGIWLERGSQPAILFNRVVFPVVSRSSGLEIALSWEVLF